MTQSQNNKSLAIAPISALLISLFLAALGNGLQGTLVAVRAGLENFHEETIGLIMSSYFIGYMFGAVVVPNYVVRVGHIRTFVAMASIASAAALSHLLIIEPISWAFFRAVNGFCIAGLSLVIESWLNGHAVEENRGQILSIYGLVVVVAIGLGQLLLNIADPSHFFLFCIVSIIISLSLVPVSLTHSVAPTITGSSHFNLPRLLKLTPLGVIGTMITGMTMSAYLGMGPIFAQKIGLNTAGISVFMTAIMTGTLVLHWPIGRLSDRIDRRVVIALVTLTNGIICFGFASWNTSSLKVLLPVAFLLGGFGQPLYALCVAHANDNISTDEILSTASSLLLVFSFGSSLGPFFASLIMGQIGPKGLFLLLGLLYLFLFLFTLYHIKQHPKVKQEGQHSGFVSTYTRTHLGVQIDTKNENMEDTTDPDLS